MDKRKLAAALALGGSIAIASMFGGSDEPVSGSYRGGYYAGAGSYRMGTTAADTFRLLVQDGRFMNSAAVDSGWVDADSLNFYDQVTSDDGDGLRMRYGCIRRATAPDISYYSTGYGVTTTKTSEDNNATLPTFTGFFAFNVSGLTEGHKIEDAFIALNVMDFGTNDFSTGYCAARIDTVVSDYLMLDSVSDNVNTQWLDTAWNFIDVTQVTAWPFSPNDKDDMHDYGPRGEVFAPGVSYINNDDGIKLDITDPLQQVLDNGFLDQTDGWIIVMVYQVGTPGLGSASWAASHTGSRLPSGNPALVATTTSKRGPEPWGGGGLPVVYTWDDNFDDQIGYFQIMTAFGYEFTSMASGSGMLNVSFDSLNTENPGAINYVAHSVTHTALGTLTGAALDAELDRGWFENLGRFTVIPDTSLIVDFAYPVWIGSTYSLEVMEKISLFNYRSSRGVSATWTPGGVGYSNYLSWDAPVNMNLIGSPSLGLIFQEGGAPATNAEIEENLTDAIDKWYTDYGRAAFISYGHQDTTTPGEDVTPANLAYCIGLIENRTGVQMMDYDDVISMRDGARIDPGTVAGMTFLTVDSLSVKLSAAQHDSLIGLTGHDPLLDIWVDRKEIR